jgi:sensor histidine kinase YesM
MQLSAKAISRLVRDALLAMALNAAIAITLTAFGNDTLIQNMLYSQLIGMSIWLLIDVGRHFLHPEGHVSALQAVILTLVGCVLGYFVGSALGDAILGHDILSGWQRAPERMAGFLLLSLIAGSALVYFFMSREVLISERGQRELAERQRAQAQLQLLRSQLDPHMLFNTLANLRSLVSEDPARAVQMIDQLSDFLRATLSASRSQEHSLRAEFERLRDYLALMQVRMGDRLAFSLDLPESLAPVQVPSLILQSIVENAIVHGLEPKVGGGRVQISASVQGDRLSLDVQDNGLGLRSDASPQNGFGLQQVRERLQARYGAQATIEFIADNPDSMRAEAHSSSESELSKSGCHVRITLPLQTAPLAQRERAA